MLCPRAALLLACAAFLLGAACGDPTDPVILRLGRETVRRSEFERHLAAIEARNLGPLDLDARRGLLDSFLEQRALVLEARGRGLVAAGATSEEEQRGVARLFAEVLPKVDVTDAEVEAYYRAHPEEFRARESVTLRQILVPTLNEARDVKRKLAREPRSFDPLARRVSRGPEAATGGYMGSFERGQLPSELEEAVFALRAGATSEVLQTPLGYHVVRVESRQEEREIGLEEARARVRAQVLQGKVDEAQRAFVAGVLTRAKVNHEAALRPSRPS